VPQYSSSKGPEQELETAPPAAECSLTLQYLDTALPGFVPDTVQKSPLLTVLRYAVKPTFLDDAGVREYRTAKEPVSDYAVSGGRRLTCSRASARIDKSFL
jgi:hypothetical protein